MWASLRSAQACFVFVGICLAMTGCHNTYHYQQAHICVDPGIPRENRKSTIRDYVIHAPDVLVINLDRAVPLPPYIIKTGDLLYVQVKGTSADDPIKGAYRVEPEGILRLGPGYGSVAVVDLSIDDSIKAITEHLKKSLREPQVSVSL